MNQQCILVVDDEAPMRKLLSSNLKASGYAVHTAADGTEAMKLIEEQTFDLLLLDINMPGPNGIQVLQAVRRGMEFPVLILSGRGRERDKVEAFDLGADDYLTKPFGIGELVARIKALLRRGSPGPRETVPAYRYGGLEVDFAARCARVDGVQVRLTRREFEVLAYFARNAGKILLHRQVLQAVWGGQYGDETDYVWNFVQKIRRKIEPDRARPRYLLTGALRWVPHACTRSSRQRLKAPGCARGSVRSGRGARGCGDPRYRQTMCTPLGIRRGTREAIEVTVEGWCGGWRLVSVNRYRRS